MGLHIGEAAIEKPRGALDGERFDLVDISAAAVIAPARIAFGVFVGENMFSDAMSSICPCWRASSRKSGRKISGSRSANDAAKKGVALLLAVAVTDFDIQRAPLLFTGRTVVTSSSRSLVAGDMQSRPMVAE
jgi:hypothetical protein